MSAEQDIETARQVYEAFGRGDVQAVLDRVTDDVDWSTDAAILSAPSSERSPAVTSPRSATCCTPTRPGTTATTTALAASTAVPTRSSPT